MIKLLLITLTAFTLKNHHPQDLQSSGTMKVIVSNLRNDKGQVALRVYKSKEGFPTDGKKAFKEIYSKPSGGKAIFNIPLEFGFYALGTIHDENSNKKFDKNFIGFPQEGFGASRNPKVVFSPPSFSESKFEFEQSGQSVSISMKYF